MVYFDIFVCHNYFKIYIYNQFIYIYEKWEILCRTKTKPNGNKICKLCSLEKYEIEKTERTISLNKRKERQQPCLHNQKIYFNKIKTTF